MIAAERDDIVLVGVLLELHEHLVLAMDLFFFGLPPSPLTSPFRMGLQDTQ